MGLFKIIFLPLMPLKILNNLTYLNENFEDLLSDKKPFTVSNVN